MKNIFKLIFLFSLIINSLSADSCSSITSPGSCTGECQWVEAVTKACEAIDDVMTEECGEETEQNDCPNIKSGSTAVCVWTAANTPKCGPVTANIATLCGAADADQSTCTAVKSGDTVLCEFTPASPAKCITKPVTFSGAITIKLKSVKGKAVVITLEPAAADQDKKVTAETAIKNLQLTSGSSFTKDLTCKIASGSKLGDVDCTMDTAATKDTKYKLAKSGSTVTFNGADTFSGAVTVNEDEVTATEDTSPSGSPDNNSSSYMKISSFFTFLFLLF